MEAHQEHRSTPRHRTFKAAHIAFKERGAAISCVVRDLSDTGACLKVESPIGIPETFDLVFESDQSIRTCRVVWRKANQIGIEFR
jgi:hypothetical protein